MVTRPNSDHYQPIPGHGQVSAKCVARNKWNWLKRNITK